MNPETKKFLRNRKIESILPWIGVVGMIILTFSPIFGGFPLFFTELGFVANFYFFIDEYNWFAQHLLIKKDHTINHNNETRVKTLFYFTIAISIIYAIFLSYLRNLSFTAFVVGASFLYVIYFSKHDIDYALIIFRQKFENKKYHSILIIGTLTVSLLLLIFYFLINWLSALFLLIILSCLYVFERDVMKEMKKHGAKIDWDDDDDRDRFSARN